MSRGCQLHELKVVQAATVDGKCCAPELGPPEMRSCLGSWVDIGDGPLLGHSLGLRKATSCYSSAFPLQCNFLHRESWKCDYFRFSEETEAQNAALVLVELGFKGTRVCYDPMISDCLPGPLWDTAVKQS